MAKEVEMSVKDTIDLDAVLAQFIREHLGKVAEKAGETTPADKPKEEKDEPGN